MIDKNCIVRNLKNIFVCYVYLKLFCCLVPHDHGDTEEVRKAKGFIRDMFKVMSSARN